ncbi:c-type cytochrome [Marinobacter fonticola]|uniref:c-type cytochrome n=1 Tax=Marinobacter fonticola TaxID=2603215 RepID=UPI001D0DAC33|nr:c-type cytochrome [Marinobacter fonticola]
MTRKLLAVGLLFASWAVWGGGKPESDSTRQGRQLYQQHCAACHGREAEGADEWKARNAVGELPPPPHDETGHTWRHSDSMLFKMIADGWRDPFNKTDRLTMPAFGDTLSDTEIRHITEYLKTLWTEAQRVYQVKQSQ